MYLLGSKFAMLERGGDVLIRLQSMDLRSRGA